LKVKADLNEDSSETSRTGAVEKDGKRSATVYQKKEGVKQKSQKKLGVKKGSNEDLNESSRKIAFYQPV